MTFAVEILTLFPEMFPGPLEESLAGRALQQKIWSLKTINIRDFATDTHKTVDDTPFGGGPGMVLKPEIIHKALESRQKKSQAPLIYLTPRGKPLKQDMVKAFASGSGLTLVCGRYEGVDQRVIEHYQMQEVSVGDYILSGGELAAMILVDATLRLIPGVMGDHQSKDDESFENGLLEYPHYTKPQEWQGKKVPPVLLSGHHQEIQRWRQCQAELVTQERRPDLWDLYNKR